MPEIIEILQLNDDFFEPNRVKRQNSNNNGNIPDQTTIDFGLLNEEFGSGTTIDTETSTIFNDVEFTTEEISTSASSVSTTVTSEGSGTVSSSTTNTQNQSTSTESSTESSGTSQGSSTLGDSSTVTVGSSTAGQNTTTVASTSSSSDTLPTVTPATTQSIVSSTVGFSTVPSSTLVTSTASSTVAGSSTAPSSSLAPVTQSTIQTVTQSSLTLPPITQCADQTDTFINNQCQSTDTFESKATVTTGTCDIAYLEKELNDNIPVGSDILNFRVLSIEGPDCLKARSVALKNRQKRSALFEETDTLFEEIFQKKNFEKSEKSKKSKQKNPNPRKKRQNQNTATLTVNTNPNIFNNNLPTLKTQIQAIADNVVGLNNINSVTTDLCATFATNDCDRDNGAVCRENVSGDDVVCSCPSHLLSVRPKPGTLCLHPCDPRANPYWGVLGFISGFLMHVAMHFKFGSSYQISLPHNVNASPCTSDQHGFCQSNNNNFYCQCNPNYSGLLCETYTAPTAEPQIQVIESSTSTVVAIVAISISSLVAILLLIILIYYCKNRNRRLTYRSDRIVRSAVGEPDRGVRTLGDLGEQNEFGILSLHMIICL